MNTVKRIHPDAYNALADALCAVTWNKIPFTRLIRGLLREAPEIVLRLDFSETKRETAGRVVEMLMENETRYQELTIKTMLAVAEMEHFPNLETQVDREEKLTNAKLAVESLRRWVERHRELAEDYERHAGERAADARRAEEIRAFSKALSNLRGDFLSMHSMANPQARGLAFERFINQLFGLFDLEPRASYSLDREQLDGAFSFDTDDYILEAKWWNKPIGRDHLDVFKAKISRKGKNALGLFISINNFTSDAREEYQASTPFITMTGEDLYAVLEERIRLEDLLRRKKRHMNETGSCYLSYAEMI